MGLNEGELGGGVEEPGGGVEGEEHANRLVFGSIRLIDRCLLAGEVKLKVTAEALKTNVLCGNEVATLPKTGRIDTVERRLLVEVCDGDLLKH